MGLQVVKESTAPDRIIAGVALKIPEFWQQILTPQPPYFRDNSIEAAPTAVSCGQTPFNPRAM